MASRNTDFIKGYGKDLKVVAFKFFPQGTGAPVVNAAESRGVASITRTGVGTFLVTLTDAYRVNPGYKPGLQSSAAAALYPQIGDISNVGTSSPVTIVFRIVNGSGAATDMSAGANNSVSCELTFNDSGAY